MKSEDPFLKYSKANVPEQVSTTVLEQNRLVVDPNLGALAFKYSLLFVCSLFVSLAVCPQRGVGLFAGSLSLVHHLLHQSEILCGLYCGLMFFLTTHGLSFLFLSHFERLKIINSLSLLPVFSLSAFFGLSMTSFFSNLNLSASYFLSWAVVVVSAYFLLNRAYISKFS